MTTIRLHKWISQLGLASNRQAEKWIKDGRIKVDGEVVTTLGASIDPTSQEILLDDKPIQGKEPPRVYWMLNKPDYMMCTRSSSEERESIFDLPALKKLTFPVSVVDRLDYRGEGLVVLSNDGELVHEASRAECRFERQYQVLVSGKLTRQQERELRTNLVLKGKRVEVRHLEYLQGKKLGATRGSWYLLCIMEGSHLLVRKVFESFDQKVIRLVRIGFADLGLREDLKPGQYRQLSSEEIRTLKKATGLIGKTRSEKSVKEPDEKSRVEKKPREDRED
jgi:23S rRNA pseudouridine2605 synthase